ncbi:MAG TPA: alpha/beta fold hydrolase [Patescibacteria group bacterium]|nr:alpha/beta fold hydrolase [Patescibacteria group bacterium]
MQVVIFHGWGNTGESHWFPCVKAQLEQRGHTVLTPDLPDADLPDLAKWLPFANTLTTYDEQTVLIGHSAGWPLILAMLERLHTPVRQAISVAGFFEPLSEKPEDEPPILQGQYDWKKIATNAHSFTFIHSDDDPFGCGDTTGRNMWEHLGGTLVIPKGQGHFGSNDPKRDYPEFPLLVQLIGV